jgi:hypothetical protein
MISKEDLMRFWFAAALIALSTVAALAQDPAPTYQPETEAKPDVAADYVDDRSDPIAVIVSFYNAINRKEYARAYSYYGDAQQAGDFQTFADGYAKTEHVELLAGSPTAEGAAGSTYYSLPVAIDAEDGGGGHKQYAGCYLLRLSNPAIQAEPPFTPMHIEKGELKPASGELKAILPEQCDLN